MSSSVPAALLQQLSTASEALNNVSDIFNSQIRVIEEALASYNVGVTAWVHAYTDASDLYDSSGNVTGAIDVDYSIGYDKSGGKWCLMVASSSDYYPGRSEWVLLDAPRQIRIKAIGAIPKLIEALVAKANQLAEEISKKTSDARMLAASLKPKAKGQ